MDGLRSSSLPRPASPPEPFWTRLRAIALYPFRGAALFSMIALTLCSLVAYLPGMVGLILTAVVWLSVYKYAFDILRHTADGYLDAPEYGLTTGDGTVWRLLMLMILLGIAVGFAAVLAGPVIGLLALLALVFLQPGCIISLAMDGSLLHAANPATPLTLATRIGWPYLAAFGLLFVIQASALTAGHWAVQWLPPVVSRLALNLFGIWGLYAAFHLMGYLVYQYHEQLGYEPASLLDRVPARDAPDQRLLDEAEQYVRDGKTDAALDTLRAEVRSRAVGLPVHELYQRLLRGSARENERRDHARQFIGRLLHEKQERKALAVLREALDSDPGQLPLSQEQAGQLAERAQLSGQSQLTADLLRAMLAQWPDAAQAPQWSLQAALLLAERFGRDDEARQLLADALQRCDDGQLRDKLLAAQKALVAASV